MELINELKIEQVALEQIKPYKNNAKKHPQSQVDNVAESIKTLGWRQPIVLDKNGVIIIGHGRFLAAKQLGLKTAPCHYACDLSEEQTKKLRLLDNKLNESEWDLDLLKLDAKGLDFKEYDLDWGVFETEEPTTVVEDEIPEVDEENKPITQLGDIWKLGEHRLMCGNSLSQDDIDKLLNGEKCELTFTDPPYQLKTQGGGILKKANSMKQIKENGVDEFDPLELLLQSDTNIYCHNKPLIKKYIELAEKNNQPYDLCFYKKLCTVPNYKGHMMTDCEYIAIIGKQDPNKGLEKETYSKCYIGKKDHDNELSYSKPVELCAKYIKLYAKKNVLDLFGGSGSTLIACEQLNRVCYMCELDPKYCDVIVKRWETFTGKKAVKV